MAICYTCLHRGGRPTPMRVVICRAQAPMPHSAGDTVITKAPRAWAKGAAHPSRMALATRVSHSRRAGAPTLGHTTVISMGTQPMTLTKTSSCLPYSRACDVHVSTKCMHVAIRPCQAQRASATPPPFCDRSRKTHGLTAPSHTYDYRVARVC